MDKVNKPGSENLIPLNERTKEEQKKIATMGGIASGKSRAARKTLKEELLLLLENEDIQKKISLALIDRAMTYDTMGNKAFEVIRDTIGEKPKEEIEQRQEVKVVMDDKLEEWGK